MSEKIRSAGRAMPAARCSGRERELAASTDAERATVADGSSHSSISAMTTLLFAFSFLGAPRTPNTARAAVRLTTAASEPWQNLLSLIHI